jgi:hypothetical protein
VFERHDELVAEGDAPISAKITLDPARIGTILGADANHGICPCGPVP